MCSKEIERALVVGAGVMGHSIAQVFAQAGIDTYLVDLNDELLEHGVNLIKSNLTTLANFGKISYDRISTILGRIHPSTELASCAKDTDFAIEVVPEKPESKKKVFSQLDEFCPPDAIIASNTSGLDIFSIADVGVPERLIIAHWYAPAHIIPLVEIAPGPKTSPAVTRRTVQLLERLGKKTVVMNQFIPGFIVNRIQNAIALTVFDILEQGLASPEEVDRAVKLSLGIRLPVVGVVQTLDFTGLDIVHQILTGLGINISIVEEKVNRGALGAKTSRGIYDYEGRSEEEILKKRDELYLKMMEHLENINAFEPV